MIWIAYGHSLLAFVCTCFSGSLDHGHITNRKILSTSDQFSYVVLFRLIDVMGGWTTDVIKTKWSLSKVMLLQTNFR